MFGVVAAHPTTALVPSYAIIDPLKDWTLVKVLPNWQAEHFGVFALMPSRQFVAAKTRAWLDLIQETLPAALERDESFSIRRKIVSEPSQSKPA
jgi:DNA-binding transcriptional LysR family regulator